MSDINGKLASFSEAGVVKAAARVATIGAIPLFLWVLQEINTVEKGLHKQLDRITQEHVKIYERLITVETEHSGLLLPMMQRHEDQLERLQVNRPRFDTEDARRLEQRLLDRMHESMRHHEQTPHPTYDPKINP